MALVTVQTSSSRAQLLDLAIEQLRRAKELNRQAERLSRDLRLAAVDPANVEDQVGELMTAAASAVASADTFMTSIYWQNQIVVSIGAPGGYTSAGIDVNNGSGKAVLTAANSTTPYDVFLAADVVQVSNAETAAHNDTRTVEGTPGATLTFTTTLSGLDNTDDEAVTVTLLERNV